MLKTKVVYQWILLFSLFFALTAISAAEDSSNESSSTTASNTPVYGQMSPQMMPMYSQAYAPWAAAMNQNSMWYNQMANSGMDGLSMQAHSMFNPALHSQWMSTMMNPAVQQSMAPMMSAMTQPQMLEAMMRSMNPRVFAAMMGGFQQAVADGEVPNQLPLATIPGFPVPLAQNWPVNTVTEPIDEEAKKNAFQTMMMMSPLGLRDMVSIMTYKIPLEDGVSWEDAVDSMKLRANEVNFKFVGSSPLSKQIEAMTEEPSPRIEIFRFCDALVARKILDVIPEFVVFLPCRIALIEDAQGKLWVMTLDWNVDWLNFSQNPNSHLSKELRTDARRIRESIQYIMEGAATGDF